MTDVRDSTEPLCIVPADLDDARVIDLLNVHVTTARAQTGAGSAHALDVARLRAPDILLWAAWRARSVVGIAALRRLTPQHGEVKSMHVAAAHRRGGVGALLLRQVIEAARALGLHRLMLETGSWEYFLPARAFYASHGFVECAPFGDYAADPNSVFMDLDLAPGRSVGDEA